MYRKYIIKDEEGKELSFNVFPHLAEKENLIVPAKSEISMVIETKEALHQMLKLVNKFMDGNTINHLEVTEMEEV